MPQDIFARIGQTRSAIMETPEMRAHIERWGFSFARAKTLVSDGNGRYLVVEEKRACINGVWQDVRDIWNFPGGSLESPTEDLFSAAHREVQEETGYEIKLTGLLDVNQKLSSDNPHILFMFLGKPCGEGSGKIDTKEIWQAAWLSEEEIMRLHDAKKLRSDATNLQMLRLRHYALPLSAITCH